MYQKTIFYNESGHRWPTPTLFTLCVILYLIPIWGFSYLPTQDGPHHLANAVILKDYGALDTRYHEVFQIQREPFPNWTTQLLLVSLLHLFSPLVAEKVLVSLYVAGFAYSFRYFLKAFGTEAQWLSPLALLLLFNRCFLMGFYNYCLSIIIYWLILGFCLRRREKLGPSDAFKLCGLFLLAYFSHLLGYALAGASVFWVILTIPGRRVARLGWTGMAVLPTALLATGTLIRPGLLGLREHAETRRGFSTLWPRGFDQLWSALEYVDDGLFSGYAGSFPLGMITLIFIGFLLLHLIVFSGRNVPSLPFASLRWPVGTLGLAMGLLYLVVPDSFSLAIGYLKARLVILPPMLCLACFSLPATGIWRRCVVVGVYLLVGLNLTLVTLHFRTVNRDLVEFTGAGGKISEGHTLFVVQSPLGPHVVNPFEHAADYYCLQGRNINMDNFQATVAHFPIHFRAGVMRGYGSFSTYPFPEIIDLIVVWGPPAGQRWGVPEGFCELHHQGRLTIFQRIGKSR